MSTTVTPRGNHPQPQIFVFSESDFLTAQFSDPSDDDAPDCKMEFIEELGGWFPTFDSLGHYERYHNHLREEL